MTLRKILFTFLLALTCQLSVAQHQFKFDSLQSVFARTTNDSLRMELLFGMSPYILNMDTQLHYLGRARKISDKIHYSSGPDRVLDSLNARLKSTRMDSDKVKLYYTIAEYQTYSAHWTKFYSTGIALAAEKGFYQLQAKGLNSFGKSVMDLGMPGNFTMAIELYDSALKVATRARDSSEMGWSSHYLGEIYRFKGDYARALEYYNKGNTVATLSGDSTQMMLNFHDLGWMRISMKNYEGSFDYLKKARELAIATKDSFWIGDMALHLGEAFWSAKQYDSSLHYSNMALALFMIIKDTGHIVGSLNQMGMVYESREEWKDAEVAYRSALKWSEDSTISGVSFSGLGDALYGEGRYSEALLNYVKAERYLSSYPITIWTRDTYEGLAKTYAKLGDFKNAYEAHIKFKSASDSVLTLENAEKLTATQAQHDFDRLHTAMKLEQEKKDALQVAELSKQKSQKNIFIAGGIFLLILAGGLVNRLLYTRRSKKQLEEKNKLIALEKEAADQQRARAEQSEKFKQQFLANMSHEIRTPMNAISGMTNLLLKKNPREDQLKYLEGIYRSSNNLIVIINDILDLSKIEAGKIEIEKTDFRPGEVVDLVYETMKFKADEKGLHFTVDWDKRIPEVLIGDPVRLNQVLTNLTANAIKFTPEGRVTQTVKLMAQKSTTAIVQFLVSDTGIGIPKEKLDSVFESFTQASSDTTRKFGGTGLGLTISRQLIELQGGKISLQSEEGKGTTFSFIMEYPVGTAAHMQAGERRAADDWSALNGMRVLIADDNEYNRVVAEDTLKTRAPGVVTVQAINGKEVIDLLRNKTEDLRRKTNDVTSYALPLTSYIDIILMDVHMPEMDGYEATRAIRRGEAGKQNQEIPIIALTASVIKSDLDKCTIAGMNGYIPKPFTEAQLFNGMLSVLHGEKQSEVTAPVETGNSAGYSMPAAEAVDLTYLKNFCDGDQVRMKKYISMFLESLPAFREKLESGLAENNWAEIARQVHAMKPKFMMMGLKEAESLSIQIETHVRAGSSSNDAGKDVKRILQLCVESAGTLAGFSNGA